MPCTRRPPIRATCSGDRVTGRTPLPGCTKSGRRMTRWRFLNRLFLLQHHEDRLYLPRSPDVTAGMTEEERQGTWYLVRADFPADAIAHARAVIAGQCTPEDRSCGQCTAEAVGTGAWQETIDLAASTGITVTPQHPRDRQVPSVRA